MYGAYYNHLETVKALVDAGAILVIPEEKVSSEAKLTKELSSLTGNPEIIQLLKMAVKLDTEVGKEADFGADKDQQFLSSSSRSTDDKGVLITGNFGTLVLISFVELATEILSSEMA